MRIFILLLISGPLFGSEPRASLLSEARYVLLSEVSFKSIKVVDMVRYFEIEYNHNLDRRLEDVHSISIDLSALRPEIRAMEIDFACKDLPITGVLSVLTAKYRLGWQAFGYEAILSNEPAPSSLVIKKKYESESAICVEAINTGDDVVLNRGTIEIIYECVGGVWRPSLPVRQVPGEITLLRGQSALLVAKKNNVNSKESVVQLLVDDRPLWLYFSGRKDEPTGQP